MPIIGPAAKKPAQKVEEDTSEDERLSEDDALTQAADEGIEFVDYFTISGDDHVQYESREDAVEAADGDESRVVQNRRTRLANE